MNSKLVCLIALMALGQTVLTHAADIPHKDGVPDVIGGMESTAKSKALLAERRKSVAKIKPVDINSANADQLKKLPGIGDAEAQRIIAGRPYGSKIWLVTNGVIGEGPYTLIKNQIAAKQPYKTAAENAAFYEKMKKEKAAKPKP